MPDTIAWPLLLIHLSATLFMTGLIWFVQVVHYPLKARVGRPNFAPYQEGHVQLTGWVVAPVMLIEALSAAALALWPPALIDSGAPLFGLGLLLIVWASTAVYSVPAHARLSSGFDARVHRRLVNTNWIRTIAWTLRALLWGLVLATLTPPPP